MNRLNDTNLKTCVYACRLTFCLFILSLLVRVFVSSNVGVQGDAFADLYRERETLINELIALEVEDTSLSALSSVEKRAYEYGFIPVTDSLLVLKPASVAALVPLDE